MNNQDSRLSTEMRMIEKDHGIYVRNQVASIFPDKKIYFMSDYSGSIHSSRRDPQYFVDFQIAFTNIFHEIKHINQNHLQEVKNKKAYLAYEMYLESGEAYVKWMYAKCIKEGLPPEQIIIIGSSLDFQAHSEKYAAIYECKPMINIYYTFFERNTKRRFLLDSLGENNNIDINSNLKVLESLVPSIPNFTNPLAINQFKKRFIFLNNIPRIHRFCLLSLLHSHDLIKNGYVSFLGRYLDKRKLDIEIKLMFDDVNKYNQVINGSSIENKIPLYVDNLLKTQNESVYTNGNPANLNLSTLYGYINHSFVNIAAETFFNNDKSRSKHVWNENIENRFLTEKTFKCIAFKQPFILVTLPNSLKMLRYLGYKTFSPIIDESYDLIENDGERLYRIFLEIKRLCELDEVTLESYRQKLIPIVEHNFNLLMNRKDFFHPLLPTSKSVI
jgi:hypothetical protein